MSCWDCRRAYLLSLLYDIVESIDEFFYDAWKIAESYRNTYSGDTLNKLLLELIKDKFKELKRLINEHEGKMLFVSELSGEYGLSGVVTEIKDEIDRISSDILNFARELASGSPLLTYRVFSHLKEAATKCKPELEEYVRNKYDFDNTKFKAELASIISRECRK